MRYKVLFTLTILSNSHENFKWSEVVRGLLSPSTWLSATAYFGILAGLYSFGLFLPTIIVELGYTANEAQLWSVIPYAVASVITVVISVISDLTWAYAVVLTTPLVVTVGLSLSIPLSILGQIFINAQGSTVPNWIGAGIVLVAFILVNREEREDPDAAMTRSRQD